MRGLLSVLIFFFLAFAENTDSIVCLYSLRNQKCDFSASLLKREVTPNML